MSIFPRLVQKHSMNQNADSIGIVTSFSDEAYLLYDTRFENSLAINYNKTLNTGKLNLKLIGLLLKYKGLLLKI